VQHGKLKRESTLRPSYTPFPRFFAKFKATIMMHALSTKDIKRPGCNIFRP